MSVREISHPLSTQDTFMVVEGKKNINNIHASWREKNSKNMIITTNMDFQKYGCSIKQKSSLKKFGFWKMCSPCSNDQLKILLETKNKKIKKKYLN